MKKTLRKFKSSKLAGAEATNLLQNQFLQRLFKGFYFLRKTMEKILQNVLKTLPLSRIHRFTDLLTNGVSSLEEQ